MAVEGDIFISTFKDICALYVSNKLLYGPITDTVSVIIQIAPSVAFISRLSIIIFPLFSICNSDAPET
jgi:hypothetical protein